MASSRRSAKHTVSQRLRSEPYRFSFVQAVHLLERIGQAASPRRQSIGGNALPSQESVQLAASPTLSFPPTEISALKIDDPLDAEKLFGAKPSSTAIVAEARGNADSESTDGDEQVDGREPVAVNSSEGGRSAADGVRLPPKLIVGFMGLFGPSGVLPQHDTQRIINAGPRKNPERDFLDIFNHRILSYFYRASIKYRLPFAYEMAYREANSNSHLSSRCLYSLAGMGTPGLQSRLIAKDEFAIEFCGLLRHQPKNGVSLRRMLSAYFGLPFQLYQFVGQWLTLTEDNRSLMPSGYVPLGQNCQLGSSFIVGDRVWDVSGKFRLRLGPLTKEQFESFLPGTRNLAELAQIVRWYVGNQFDFDIQLELLAEAVPEIQLDESGNALLGFNSWLISDMPAENKLEAILVHSGLPVDSPTHYAA